ncbi:MAG: hypothetical protein M0P31_02995 [Solirubrobacteraceae bacterium]|nr:hypothetical protein [Solirubrobacteraceae bacterium]
MPRPAVDHWAASDAAADPVRHALRLARAHEDARTGTRVSGAIRSVIDRSWRRSVAAGVDPVAPAPASRVSDDALARRRVDHPLAAVRGLVLRLLDDLTRDTPYVVALSDASGVLLWVAGSDGAVERAVEEMAFAPGIDWSERGMGTNAVGTALVEDHAVQIFSAEHFRPAVHGWTCSAAPIHDPDTGRVLGVVDATADLRTVDPRTLPFLAAAARATERHLQGRAERRDARLLDAARHRPAGSGRPALVVNAAGRVLAVDGRPLPRAVGDDDAEGAWRLAPPGPDGGPVLLPDGRAGDVLPVGRDGFLVYAPATSSPRPTVVARLLGTASPHAGIGGPTTPDVRPVSRGHAEILALLTVHGEGLSADALAALLHGDAASATAVRTACSRLRSRLPGALQTRPYRLAPGVTSDLADVRAHLVAGRVRDAVDAYAGPLLPDSDAPGVVALAEDLHAEVRGALLEAGDPDALATWCARPHGADDLPVADALVRALPAGDPRRGAAAGRAQAVRRRLGLRPSGLH